MNRKKGGIILFKYKRVTEDIRLSRSSLLTVFRASLITLNLSSALTSSSTVSSRASIADCAKIRKSALGRGYIKSVFLLQVMGASRLTLNSLAPIAVHVWFRRLSMLSEVAQQEDNLLIHPNKEWADFLCSIFPTSSRFFALSLSINIVPSTGVYRIRRE